MITISTNRLLGEHYSVGVKRQTCFEILESSKAFVLELK